MIICKIAADRKPNSSGRVARLEQDVPAVRLVLVRGSGTCWPLAAVGPEDSVSHGYCLVFRAPAELSSESLMAGT